LVNQPKPEVALFGGSFDPPHKGHQEIIEKALVSLDIDRLIVLPAYLNPFKSSSVASAVQRLAWCRELFGSIPKVVVDDYEIRQGKSIRTAQSVEHFTTYYDVKYLIIGADNLSTLTEWYRFEWLNAHITWVIATRSGHPIKTDMLRSWRVLEVNTPVSSTEIRQTSKMEYIDKKIEKTVKKILKGHP
jgi:nicotinate-nucleotide adenylyltransferase